MTSARALAFGLTLWMGCTVKTSSTGRPRPEPVKADALELMPDPIDRLTGEALDADGRVPPRTHDPSNPSYVHLPTEELWKAIVASDNRAFIVVKSPDQARGFYQDKLLVTADDVAAIKHDMLATTKGLVEVRDDRAELQPPRTVTGMVFPGFVAKIDTVAALTKLRARTDLDYIEPLYFEMMLQSGCGYEPYVASSLPWLLDETKSSGTQTDIVPYTFRHLGITNAWKRFPNPGAGVMVAVLDTGMSLTQDQLQGRFQIGRVASATHLDSTGTGLDDTCGHGTKVAGILSAPNDGRNIVGALYAGSLTTVKVGDAPVQDVFSGSGWVCDGIAKAVGSGARVINMSFGFLISSPTVEACIRSVFDSTTVIFVAAAGTGPQGGVIFPGNMDREVVAVTAVDIDGPGTYHMIGQATISSVGYGQNVDFASAYAGNRMASPGPLGVEQYVGQATQDFPPGNLTFPYSQIAAGGGSSSATPTLSAMFALAIQSQVGTSTRAAIIGRVVGASTIVNVRNADGSQIGAGHIGAGIPDAYALVGGPTSFDIVGPVQVQVGQPFDFHGQSNGASALVYTWRIGNALQQISTKDVTFPGQAAPGPVLISVAAVDPIGGRTFTATRTVTVIANPVPPPTSRSLSSVSTVFHHPSFGSSGQFDQIVNAGISMPSGCELFGLYGRLQCPDGAGAWIDCPQTADESIANYGGRGFTVPVVTFDSRSLATNVHYWHDSFNGVVVRVKYRVWQSAGVVCDVPGFTQ